MTTSLGRVLVWEYVFDITRIDFAGDHPTGFRARYTFDQDTLFHFPPQVRIELFASPVLPGLDEGKVWIGTGYWSPMLPIRMARGDTLELVNDDIEIVFKEFL